MKRSLRIQAFTLIEMLVVISVICLLAAILFPVFAQVQEKARAASCASNLKQIGIAFQMYNQDFDHRTLQADQTEEGCPKAVLNSYIKNEQLWLCPSETHSTALLGADARYVSYQFNNQIVDRPEARFTRPAELVITYDSVASELGLLEGNTTDDGLTTDWPHRRASCAKTPGPGTVSPCGMESYLEANFVRHNGSFNVLYVDGHVKSNRATQFTDANFIP